MSIPFNDSFIVIYAKVSQLFESEKQYFEYLNAIILLSIYLTHTVQLYIHHSHKSPCYTLKM